MTVALVTGAAGFVAQHLVPVLRKRRFTKVIGVDLRPAADAMYDDAYTADLSAKPETQRVVERAAPDVVFHLAGLIRATEESRIRASNLDTAICLTECVREISPRTRVVLIGSAAEYGEVPLEHQPVDETFPGSPQGVYGKVKAELSGLALRMAKEYGLHVVVSRPFNITGPGIPSSLVIGAVIDRLRRALAAPPPRVIRIGKTTSIRDFIAVQDVAEGLALASEFGEPGEAYNLCTGVGTSVGTVLTKLISLTGEHIEVEIEPGLVREMETDALVGSWAKAHTKLGWSPRLSLDESLRETWELTPSAIVGQPV
ncbi:MAG TPA: NAD-dependent epimerase/dehydratase family protein [Gemmatimonadaceae bacterium]|nr:NAD-dependent epimerase/dehydratase family protein [Gemmatimonadaceae bacterium]